MGLFDREVGVAIAATAAALSPRARKAARQGAVYGIAGALKVGDVVTAAARGLAKGAEDVTSEAASSPKRTASTKRKSSTSTGARKTSSSARETSTSARKSSTGTRKGAGGRQSAPRKKSSPANGA